MRREFGAFLHCLEHVFQAGQVAASPAAAWTSCASGAAGRVASLDGVSGCSEEAVEVPSLEENHPLDPSARFVQPTGDAAVERDRGVSACPSPPRV